MLITIKCIPVPCVRDCIRKRQIAAIADKRPVDGRGPAATVGSGVFEGELCRAAAIQPEKHRVPGMGRANNVATIYIDLGASQCKTAIRFTIRQGECRAGAGDYVIWRASKAVGGFVQLVERKILVSTIPACAGDGFGTETQSEVARRQIIQEEHMFGKIRPSR